MSKRNPERSRARCLSLGGGLLAAALLTVMAFGFIPTTGATHGEGTPDCPTDLRLTTLRTASSPVLVNWTHAEGSDATNVYRSIGDDPMEHIASVPADEPDFYADEDTEGGEEHTYEVRAVFGEHESQDCPQDSVFLTAFPGAPTRVCPDEIELVAVANADASVTLRADELDREADLERRVAGEEEWTFIATLGPQDTEHRDETTDAQTTYEYRLAIDEDECDRATVTAIPFFGNAALAALGVVGAVGTYAVVRRKD